jgi:hypothetical protein
MIRLAAFFAMFCLVAPPAIAADTPPEVYSAIASELFESMPKNETVAMQPLSEEETKIPASMLRSIEVGLTSALQRASGFEIELIARDRLQAIWKEAREFQNKKFEDMVAEAGANVLLIGEIRPTSDGVEISYRAFRIKGAGTGTVVASSKPRVLAMDWEKELGVQPTEMSNAMKEMADALKRLAASGGLVAEPKAPADFYHNARILAQRGESDLAMRSYEELLKFPVLLADPVLDLASLATKLYGRDGAQIYIEKKLKPLAQEQYYLLALQVTSNEPLIELELAIEKGSVEYGPLLAAFVIACKKDPSSYSFGRNRARFKAIDLIEAQAGSGAFLASYFDPIRAEQALAAVRSYPHLRFRNNMLIPLFFYTFNPTGQVEGVRRFRLKDAVDAEKSVELCVVNDKATIVCNDVRDGAKIEDGDGRLFYTRVKLPNQDALFSWPSKFVPSKKDVIVCAMRLTYTDGRGVRISLDASELNARYDRSRPSAISIGSSWAKRFKAGPSLFYENCLSTVAKATSSK